MNCFHIWIINVHERICNKCGRHEVNVRHGEKQPKWVLAEEKK